MSSTKKILSAVISLTAAAAVITAVRYAVSDKMPNIHSADFTLIPPLPARLFHLTEAFRKAAKALFRSWTKLLPHMMKIPQFIR